jgi:hypothetical protein
MFKARIATLTISALLLCGGIAGAQQDRDFYNGVRDGGRGGQYDSYDQRRNTDRRYNNNRRPYYDNGQRYDENGQPYNNGQYNNGQYNNDPRYNNRDGYRNHQGGIGPGKGALIGGAGGAVLGALFGGGLKGSLIGGAAGAGIGAIIGKVHQNRVRRNNGYYPR